eukprot:TRINITY_DN9023_c0_g1_i1.p1 TRINITY_DN9023_c0_g1~~TRINITY_DN9023_c0_g1_i1.p1  ORF type:complete len:608 (-),score=147.37 TRINITY_DN9023_c0_g1_i1:105-1928(-)
MDRSGKADYSQKFQNEQAFRQIMRNLLRISKKMSQHAKAYASETLAFAAELLQLQNFLQEDSLTRHNVFASSLIYLGSTASALTSNQFLEISGIEEQFESPLEEFVEYDFAEVAELKNKVDKAKSDYDGSLLKVQKSITSKGRIDTQKLNEFEADLQRLRETVTSYTDEFNARWKELNYKRESKCMRFVHEYFKLQSTYFQQSHKLFEKLEPTLQEIGTHLKSRTLQENDVIKEGYISRKGDLIVTWGRYYYILKEGGALIRKKHRKDETSEVEVADTLLCTVKIPTPVKGEEDVSCLFDIIAADKRKPIHLRADSEDERNEWIKAINDTLQARLQTQNLLAGSNEMDNNEAFATLQKVPGNAVCADCDNKSPDWAVVNKGILVCLECSGVHRHLGTHVSKVRSVTLDKWEPETLNILTEIGNTKANEFFEKTLNTPKPPHNAERSIRENFIKEKYLYRTYIGKSQESGHQLDQKLFSIADKEDNLFEVLQVIQNGANINFRNPQSKYQSPLMRSSMRETVVTEFLLWNNADPLLTDELNRTALHFSAACSSYLSTKALLKFDSSAISIKNSEGKTPVELATKPEILDLFKKAEELLKRGFTNSDGN